MKPVFWHPLARLDADQAAAWYAQEGGLALELAFTAALQDAVQRLAQHPGIGSQRCGESLGMPSLRQWPVHTFPHLIFYLERDSQLDVWRVLHASTDIPAWLGEPDNDPASLSE